MTVPPAERQPRLCSGLSSSEGPYSKHSQDGPVPIDGPEQLVPPDLSINNTVLTAYTC